MEDLTGKQLGPYQIVAPLGEGGMAAVYKAYQPSMDRYVALKVLPRHFASDPEFIGRFSQEAKVIANLQHPHILPVHDFGESDGYSYLAMRFIEGGTLTDWLKENGPLSLEKIRSIMTQVGGALDYAHAQGVIHRDIKPSNILVDQWGNCLLTDFGLAKMAASTAHLTQTGGILGTPSYMSPEQGLGKKIDHRSDIYSLGVVLYQMAIGRLPYQAETPMAVVIKHIHDPLPPPSQFQPDFSEGLERVILKSLAKSPEDRFESAGEMVKALKSATEPPTLPAAAPPLPAEPAPEPEPELESEPAFESVATAVPVPPPSSPPQPLPQTEPTTVLNEPAEAAPLPAPTRKKRRPLLWAALGIIGILCLLIVGSIILITGGDDEPDEFAEFMEDGSVAELMDAFDDAYIEGDLDEALSAVSQAIDMAPDNPDLYCQRGYTFLDLADHQNATSDFEQCLALAEEQGIADLRSDALGQLAYARSVQSVDESNDVMEAIAILDEALQDPDAPPWLICERAEYKTWYDNQAALEDFEVCQAENPDDEYWPWRAESVSNMIRGDEALEQGDFYVAIEHYQHWADLVPEIPWPFCGIGDAHASMSEFAQAQEAYEKCLEMAAEDPETQRLAESGIAYTAARMALFEGDLDTALGQFSQAIELTPDNAGLYCERGVILHEFGNVDMARADYETCLELQVDPDGRAWAEELLNSLE